jgi:hypothetical protein
MTDFLSAPVDDDRPELLPQVGNGGGAGQLVPTETKIGDIVSMRRAAVLMPRQPAAIRREIAAMAEMFGEDWEYRFPVKNRRTGETDWIEGETVGCAMSVARAYGNCDVAHTRTEDEKTSWVLYSTFLDLQSGFSLTRGFRQRKGQSTMGSDRARGEDIDFQIGVSKSTRNVVSRALGDYVQYARKCAKERLTNAVAKRADEYRERIVSYLAEINYPLTAVEGATGGSIAKWSNEQIAAVVRVLSAHKDGTLRDLDEVYRPKPAEMAEARPQALPQPEAASVEPAQPRQEAMPREPVRESQREPAPASEAPTASDKPKRGGAPTNREMAAKYLLRIAQATDHAELDHLQQEPRYERLCNASFGAELELAIERARTRFDKEDDTPGTNPAEAQEADDGEPDDDEEFGTVHADEYGTGKPEPDSLTWPIADTRGDPLGQEYAADDWLEEFRRRLDTAWPDDAARLRRTNKDTLEAIAAFYPSLREQCEEFMPR